MAYKRVVSVQIGRPNEQGVQIENLRVRFQIRKSDTENKNSCELSIWNLSPETFALLQEPDVVIILRAGYEDEGGARPLFYGGVNYVTVDRSSPDWEYRIYCHDGYRKPADREISLSFAGGTSRQAIVDQIIRVYNLGIGKAERVPGRVEGGFTYTGLADGALEKILDGTGLKARVHNEIIYILRPGTYIAEFRLTPRTGLIGQPEMVKEDDKIYWRVKSVLYTDIVPDMTLEIESRDLTGFYNIKEVEYRGDTHGEDFSCWMEVER